MAILESFSVLATELANHSKYIPSSRERHDENAVVYNKRRSLVRDERKKITWMSNKTSLVGVLETGQYLWKYRTEPGYIVRDHRLLLTLF